MVATEKRGEKNKNKKSIKAQLQLLMISVTMATVQSHPLTTTPYNLCVVCSHTPCLAVPSFFSPSRGSRSAESRCRNWRACFSRLCCRRDAASGGSARTEVNIAAAATARPRRCFRSGPTGDAFTDPLGLTQTVTSRRWLTHASDLLSTFQN